MERKTEIERKKGTFVLVYWIGNDYNRIKNKWEVLV